MLRRTELRGSLASGVKKHQPLSFHIELGNPLGEAPDKDRAHPEFAGEIANRGVAVMKLGLDPAHDIAEALVIRERDIKDIG